MAQDAASLIVRIEATTAQLRRELAAADRAVSGSSSKIDKELGLVDKAFARMGLNAAESRKAIGTAMAGIAAVAAGGAAGLGALVVKTAESAREIQNLSQVANASTTEFQRYAAGAKTVGIEQDKLADILKDVNDRVGDFLSTGGGEMKDFFENIAPQVGVTAEQFRKLSGPQALQLFYSSLEKANLSQAEMTFYMEAMANDTTALIPLLKNGGAGFKEMGDQAQAMGAVLSDLEIKQLEEFTRSTDEMKLAFRGASNQITTDLLPTIKDLTGLLKDPATVDAARVMASGVGQALVYIVERSVDAINWMRRLKGEIADNDIALLEAEIKRVTGMLDGSVLDRTILFGRDGVVEYYDEAELNAELVKLVVAVNKAKADAAKGPVKIDIEAPKLDDLPPTLQTTTTTANSAAKAIEKVDKALEGVDADGPAKAIKEFKDRFDDLHDSLNPAEVAARKYKDQQEFLNEVIARGGEDAAKATRDLDLLREQYEQNTRATSDWAKWTEGALERVDSAFADAWRNIGDGFAGFRDSLTNAFKQMLAELAHMAITRPIVMQIGAALGIGGAAGQATSMLGGGSGGGFDFGQLLNYGQTAYSMFTGVGPAVMAGWQSGGLTGAIQGGAGYYGNLASSAWNTASGWFGGGSAVQGGAGVMLDAGGNIVNYGAGGNLSGMLGNLGAIVGPIAGLYMAIKGYGAISDGYDFKPKDFDDEFAGVRLGAKVINAYENGITKVFGDSSFLSKALRIPVATIGGLMSSVFGGGWETKNYGLAFSVANGDFLGQSYEDQKKKGGLFGSDKKRTKFRNLDPETAAALQETYDATQAGVADLFASLSLTVEEGSLDGLQLARQKISTKGKTEEEIQQAIAEWFGSAADAMTAELNRVFATGLDLDLAGMQAFVGNLQGVNEVLRYLDVEMYDASVAGGKLAEALSAAAGGLDALAANSATYYGAFFSEAEKIEDTIDSIKRTFESADVELASSRQAYREMVEDIDLTTEAGREMFATLMALSGQAATYYDILEGQLLGAANNAYAALQRSIANQQQEIQRAASGTAAAINALTGVSNSLDAALKRLRGSSDDTVRMLRAQAVMTLNSALVTARAGGSLADYAGLQDALDVASNMDTSLYRSLEDFEREQGRTANLIAELEKVNGKQLSAEEQMLEQYEKQLSKLDEQLAFAQAQLDALNGIDNSVMGVAAAVAAMNASVVAALQGLPKGAAQANTPQNNRSIIDTIYQSVLGRGTEGDEAGAAFWANALQSGTATYQDIAASIAKGALGNSAESAATKKSAEQYLKSLGIPGFASGGLFGGGLRIVGEKGPELEVTGPSRIYNASQTAAMLGGAGSTEELRALRSEVAGLRSALGAIAKYTESTAYGVRQMNEIGLPQPEAA